jgi:hypothetical protein
VKEIIWVGSGGCENCWKRYGEGRRKMNRRRKNKMRGK